MPAAINHKISIPPASIMPKSTRSSTRTPIQPTKQTTTRRTRSRTHPAPPTPAQPPRPRRQPKPDPLAFLSRAQHVIQADPNRQLPLFRLPAELLQRIASQLELVPLICLTLTCHHAILALGTTSWTLSKREPWSMDRAEFAELFSREWGDALAFCARCDTFHPALVPPPREHVATKLTRRCWGVDACVDYLPRDEQGKGYSLLFAHIAAAMKDSAVFSSPGATGPLLDSLAADYTVTTPSLHWRLQSSAKRLDGNLLLKHTHSFRPATTGRPLHAAPILALPLRLCPHQSTATLPPPKSMYIKHASAHRNNPLLTHAISSAFPATAPQSHIDPLVFNPPAPSEQAQMAQHVAGHTVLWRCRSCATQYRVERAGEEVRVTSYHSFGRDMLHAARYWKGLVRRTGPALGRQTRNDEWWSQGRGVAGFVCEG